MVVNIRWGLPPDVGISPEALVLIRDMKTFIANIEALEAQGAQRVFVTVNQYGFCIQGIEVPDDVQPS